MWWWWCKFIAPRGFGLWAIEERASNATCFVLIMYLGTRFLSIGKLNAELLTSLFDYRESGYFRHIFVA